MSRPQFNIEDRVFYKRFNRVGTIRGIVNIGDVFDIRAQGFRYYLDINRVIHSVPESQLTLERKGQVKVHRIEAPFIPPDIGGEATLKKRSYDDGETKSNELDPLETLLARSGELIAKTKGRS
jgi:hypothetical protein